MAIEAPPSPLVGTLDSLPSEARAPGAQENPRDRQLRLAVPTRIDFYHLGVIEALPIEQELAREPHPDLPIGDRYQTVCLRLQGEITAVILVSYDLSSLDPDDSVDSTAYAEAGNLIASQTAMRLHHDLGLEIIVSPPRSLTPRKFGQILASGRTILARTYLHRRAGFQVPLRLTVVMNGTETEVGHV